MGWNFISLLESFRDWLLQKAISETQFKISMKQSPLENNLRQNMFVINIEKRADYCWEKYLSSMLRCECTLLEIIVQNHIKF